MLLVPLELACLNRMGDCSQRVQNNHAMARFEIEQPLPFTQSKIVMQMSRFQCRAAALSAPGSARNVPGAASLFSALLLGQQASLDSHEPLCQCVTSRVYTHFFPAQKQPARVSPCYFLLLPFLCALAPDTHLEPQENGIVVPFLIENRPYHDCLPALWGRCFLSLP